MKQLLILLTALFISFFTPAQQSSTVQRSDIVEKLGIKEYYIHLVLEGQSLLAIANAYKVSMAEIKGENSMIKDEVRPGDVIKIPKHKNDPLPSSQKAPIPTPVPDPIGSGSQKKTTGISENIIHTVKSGETFFGISRQYNVSLEELRSENRGVETLQPGKTIRIPVTKTKDTDTQASTPPATTNNTVQPNPTPSQPDNQPITQSKIPPSEISRPEEQSEQLNPQPIPDSYTVQAGETLFSISRRFGLSIEEITKLNPELNMGLKAGQILKLKKQNIAEKEQDLIVPDTTVSYIYHRVRRGETLYAIAKRYGLNEDVIKNLNPQIAAGLKPRQTLQIPVYIITEKRMSQKNIPDDTYKEDDDMEIETGYKNCLELPESRKVYNIAIMLPFFLGNQDELYQSDTTRQPAQTNPNMSFEFMQFYFGAMLAIDSLSKTGLKAKVYVYDVTNTLESITSVLAKTELPDMDLIIGPVYSGSFDKIANFAKAHRIKIINPLSLRNEFLPNNPYAIKAQPSAKDQVRLIASYIKTHFSDRNIIVVRQFSFSETESLEIIRKELKASSLQEVIYIRDSLPGLTRRLSKNRENIIIGLSTDNVFIMDLIRKLNDIRSDYPIVCFGLQEWENFSLDSDHIVNLRLHLPSNNFIDYYSEPVKQFIRLFRAKYNTEPLPNRFAYSAFDITWYFGSAMMKYGESFDECLPSYRYRGLQIPFDFEPKARQGMENKGLTIYRIESFRKLEVYPGFKN